MIFDGRVNGIVRNCNIFLFHQPLSHGFAVTAPLQGEPLDRASPQQLAKLEFGMQEPGNHYSTGGGKCKGCTGVLRWEMQNFADPFAEYGKIPANAEKIAKGIAFFEQVCYNTVAIN